MCVWCGEGVCVMCVLEREFSLCVCVCVGACVYMCVCVCGRERGREGVAVNRLIHDDVSIIQDFKKTNCILCILSSSAVDQPCLDPQSTRCQEFSGAAQVFHSSPQLVGGWLILRPWLMSLFPPDETVLEDVVGRLFCFFAIAECRVHDASSPQVCSLATLSCSQPEYSQGSHLREKTAFFTQKKSRLRKSENAVRLLYAKNSDLTHQNAFSLFVFCTQQRFVEHLPWV